LKILNLLLPNVNYFETKKDFHDKKRIRFIYSGVKGAIEPAATQKVRSQLPLFLAINSLWGRGANQLGKFFKLKRPSFKQIVEGFGVKKKHFITSLGKRLRKLKKPRSISRRKVSKDWWMLACSIPTYSRIYSKNPKNLISSKKNYGTKELGREEKRALRVTTFRKIFPIWNRVRSHETDGCFTDPENFELLVPSCERPKKFVKEYLSAFLYNGKLAGSQFGVYLGFHYYISRYLKRRYRRFKKRFDFVFREDIFDFNEGLNDGFDLFNKLNEYTMETKYFRRDELWYHKNYLKQTKCYLKNRPKIVKKKKKISSKRGKLNNAPFTLFGRTFPMSSFNEKFVCEGLFKVKGRA